MEMVWNIVLHAMFHTISIRSAAGADFLRRFSQKMPRSSLYSAKATTIVCSTGAGTTNFNSRPSPRISHFFIFSLLSPDFNKG